jgi:predicted secreted protein
MPAPVPDLLCPTASAGFAGEPSPEAVRTAPRWRRIVAAGVMLGFGLSAALAQPGMGHPPLPPGAPGAPGMPGGPPGHGASAANVVALSASASTEVPQDWLTVVVAATREGPDAASVQAALRQALDTALTESRRHVQSGRLEVRSGGFSLPPRYASTRPGPNGAPSTPVIIAYIGTAELVIEGRDTEAISRLASRLGTMQISRLSFTLSREAREAVEAEVTAEAIRRFRARAQAVAKHFGFDGYTLREVSVGGSEPPGDVQPMMRMQSMAVADESMPVQAGKTAVTVGVVGTVQLR